MDLYLGAGRLDAKRRSADPDQGAGFQRHAARLGAGIQQRPLWPGQQRKHPACADTGRSQRSARTGAGRPQHVDARPAELHRARRRVHRLVGIFRSDRNRQPAAQAFACRGGQDDPGLRPGGKAGLGRGQGAAFGSRRRQRGQSRIRSAGPPSLGRRCAFQPAGAGRRAKHSGSARKSPMA